eukprot:COSAG01_NODE_4686_length_4811_cov_4.669355_5_plen_92_part_00
MSCYGAQPTCENTHTRQGQEKGAWVAAHLSSRPTLLLPKDAPPADFPFDAIVHPSQNAIAVSGGPPGATALFCNHPPQESTRMHLLTLKWD